MKYIMLEGSNGIKYPIIFPDVLVHREMAQLVGQFMMKRNGIFTMSISAGFVDLGLDTMVHGESESLGIKSNELDVIRLILGTNGCGVPDEMLPGIMEKMKARQRRS